MAKLHPQGFQQTAFAKPREAEEFLSQIADSISSVRFSGPVDAFHMRYSGGSLGQCALHQGEHSELGFKVVRADEFHIVTALKNDISFVGRDGHTETAAAGRTMLLLPPTLEGQVHTPRGTHGVSLITKAASLTRHAERLLGGKIPSHSPTRAITFDTVDPVATTLQRNISGIMREMLHLSDTGLSALAAANFDELLLGLTSTLIWPVLRGRVEEVADPAPPVVRQARDYIREHADQPIRLADLAHQLGIGLRALQIGFRRHIGCSPRDYLMACRLQLARSRLLAADADTRVATVAFDSGFTDLAVFSAKYRKAFGELPSETLRKRQ